MSDKSQEIKYMIIKGIMFLSIIVLVILRMNGANFPGTTQDELGYLYTPAKLSGWDWKEVMQYHPFYGTGIGLLWLPMFKIIKNIFLIYKLIIIENGFLLALTFVVFNIIAKKIFPEWKVEYRLFSCYVVCLYPGYLFSTQIATPEVLLCLLFSITVLLLLLIIDTQKIYPSIVLAILLSYMLLVHLRTIVIIGCVGLFLIYLKLINSISWKQLIPFVGFLLIGIIAWIYVKHLYYAGMPEINAFNTTNTEIEVLGILKYILENLEMFAKRLLTRLLYFLVSGGIVFFVAFLCLIKETILEITAQVKRKSINNKKLIYIFLATNTVVNFVAFIMQGFGRVSRLDVPVYGRYMENIMGPIFIVGLYILTTEIKWIKKIPWYLGAVVCIIPFLIYQLETSETSIFAIDSAVSFGAFFEIDMGDTSVDFAVLKMLCWVVLIGISFSIAYQVTSKMKNSIFPISVLLIVALSWMGMEISAESKFRNSRAEVFEKYETIGNIIKEEKKKDITYIRSGTDDTCTDAKYLQVFLPEYTFHVINIDQYRVNEFTSKDLIFYNTERHELDDSFQEIFSDYNIDMYIKK